MLHEFNQMALIKLNQTEPKHNHFHYKAHFLKKVFVV